MFTTPRPCRAICARARSRPLEASNLAATRPNTVPVELQIPLKSIPPGRYMCQLNVTDEVGRKFAFPRTTMMVQ
jgi:hypothetical protein